MPGDGEQLATARIFRRPGHSHREQALIKQKINLLLSDDYAYRLWLLAQSSLGYVRRLLWVAQFSVGAIRGYEGRDLSRSGDI